MSCAPRTPVFWQRQPRLPLPVLRFLSARVDLALAKPADRALLAWPMILGAPKLREEHPEGIPEADLLARAAPTLAALGQPDPGAAFQAVLARLPDTADLGPAGWVPHRVWAPLAPLVSLRTGVALLCLLGLPEDDRYLLAAAASLFNSALFLESHDALEPLWADAEGPVKAGLQGLILLAGGFHHLQMHNAPGMERLWSDALEPQAGPDFLDTPWGTVALGRARAAAAGRMALLGAEGADPDSDSLWAHLWEMPRPQLELT